jgi:hypothetical protein
MERTLDIMEAELKATIEQLKPLQNKKTELEREIKDYKLKNTAYHPMSELVNYRGRDISSITLVEKKQNGMLVTEFMYNDEIFNVTNDGYLHYSSYGGGIMDYYEKEEKYYHYYYGHGTPHEYVGFLEIELEDED